MASVQRRRGEDVWIYPAVEWVDASGDTVRSAGNTSDPIKVKGIGIADRSSRAEVPGQQQINVNRLIIPADLPGVDIWARVFWRSCWWDIIAPPEVRVGDRHTHHWTVLVRKRPDDGGSLMNIDGTSVPAEPPLGEELEWLK